MLKVERRKRIASALNIKVKICKPINDACDDVSMCDNYNKKDSESISVRA